MVAILTRNGSNGSVGKYISPSSSGMSSGLARQPSGSMRSRSLKVSKQDVADAFLDNLRSRGDIDVDQDGFTESIKEHFESLPSRQAFSSVLLSCLGGFCSPFPCFFTPHPNSLVSSFTDTR
jgi:hypothetical protein